MKVCHICNQEKSLDHFHLNKQRKDGYEGRCKECRKSLAAERYRKDPFDTLARLKKSECKKKGVEYNLDADYLREIWTGICPISGEKVSIGNEGCGSHNSAHLDRVDPTKGYTKGNVAYISGRMNAIKYNATPDELRKIANWVDKFFERATTNM